MTQSIFFWMAVTCYAVAIIGFFIGAVFIKDWAILWAFRLTFTGILPHAASLVLRWVEVGHGPYSTQYEVFSSNAFILLLVFLVVAGFRHQTRGLGVFVLPAVFLMMGFAVATFGLKQEVPIIFKSYWLLLHITFAKAFGAAALIAAFCAGAFLIRQNHPERLQLLPPFEKLEGYAYQFMLISFLFLGVMIAGGSLWAYQSWGRYWAWDPIETSSLTTWIVFGVILHLKTIHGWSGRRMAYLVLLAFGFTVMTVYVVTLFVPTIHNSYLIRE